MAENTKTDAPPSCPTVDGLQKKRTKDIAQCIQLGCWISRKSWDIEEEIFQFLEDVIDGRAADEAPAEMERTGEKPVPWEKVIEDLEL